MRASNGWRSNTRSSSRRRVRLHFPVRAAKERRGKWSLTLSFDDGCHRLIRMEDVAAADVVGNVQRRHEAQHGRQPQRKRERAADGRRNHERDERPGERREESTEEKYRHDVTKNWPPIGERRAKACHKRGDG